MQVTMNKITLGKGVYADLDKLIESRLLVQANSGGGKSYSLRRFIEQTFGKKQIIIIDPEGEFGNLRSAYDFVYIGQGGDAPAEPRSAALLARRLMETKANAIIDIYELGSKRSEFVKNFMDAMVNMPKELWTDCFVILDEAHKFAPEKGQGESIALSSVIDMASLGRKRGYCLVPATQRPSKLSKDVVAECNNKLIGRASLDIDRKRSAEELGFHTKDEILSLRNLLPGEFYAFGPAISPEVIRVHIGDVDVKPPKRGTGRSIKIAPPTAKVKAILKQLSDLPQEAEKEARTVAELKTALASSKAEIARITRESNRPVVDLDAIDKAVAATEAKMRVNAERVKIAWMQEQTRLKKVFETIQKLLAETSITMDITVVDIPSPREIVVKKKAPDVEINREQLVYDSPEGVRSVDKPLSKGARTVLTYLHNSYPHWKSKTQLWVAAGYAPGGGFNNLVYELTGAGLIEKDGSGKYASLERHTPDQLEESFDPSLSKWDAKLSLGARKVFYVLMSSPNETFSKDYIAQQTGYAMGGGFNNLIYELTGKELVKKVGSEYQINPEILDL